MWLISNSSQSSSSRTNSNNQSNRNNQNNNNSLNNSKSLSSSHKNLNSSKRSNSKNPNNSNNPNPSTTSPSPSTSPTLFHWPQKKAYHRNSGLASLKTTSNNSKTKSGSSLSMYKHLKNSSGKRPRFSCSVSIRMAPPSPWGSVMPSLVWIPASWPTTTSTTLHNKFKPKSHANSNANSPYPHKYQLNTSSYLMRPCNWTSRTLPTRNYSPWTLTSTRPSGDWRYCSSPGVFCRLMPPWGSLSIREIPYPPGKSMTMQVFTCGMMG